MKTRKKPGPAPRHNWVQVRTEYIVGQESQEDIGRRYGVSLSGVERHSHNRKANAGKTWAEMRSAHRATTAARVEQEFGDDQVSLVKQINVKRTQISLKMLNRILGLDADQLKLRDLIDAAKLGIDPHLQIGGGGDPLEIDINVDVGERSTLRKLIESALGRRPHS